MTPATSPHPCVDASTTRARRAAGAGVLLPHVRAAHDVHAPSLVFVDCPVHRPGHRMADACGTSTGSSVLTRTRVQYDLAAVRPQPDEGGNGWGSGTRSARLTASCSTRPSTRS